MDSCREVLFICTGNFYRSRHAEAVLNWEARRQGLALRAFSRGLLTSMVAEEPTRLAPGTAARLAELGIPEDLTAPRPVQLGAEDLERAHLAVALRRDEHRPLIASGHPGWEDRVEYWDVRDIDELSPALALPRIEEAVRALLRRHA
jgi:protein-tyrosine phosphatase